MRKDRAHDLFLLTGCSDADPIYDIAPYNAEKARNVTVCEPRLVKCNRRGFGQAVLNLPLYQASCGVQRVV